MADIFREVDEDVRRDRAVDLWSRYGIYVIAAVVLVVTVAAGLAAWRHWEQESRRDAAAAYLAATAPSTSDRLGALAGIADARDGIYAEMARLRAAGELAAADPAQAIAAYDAISADAGVPARLRALAAVRALILAADVETPDQAIARAGMLIGDNAPFRAQAREVLATAEMKRGNDAAARAVLEQIVGDLSAPLSLRERAALMLDLVRAPEAGS
ncbi:tetratricopeptide repeat protein [Futiania mangrovi]|uniref:Tetratricopeptide repeat protein n=1 Tax=Futiania mangrovi TaxID=2959716 RepID=A0A9J6PAZ8_9PROT|nr:tetratricopeptide repeat protein [Futiania mangrovii]MCP1335625.1 tetratricopeptide repeat protein [Futiania mangrovii]